MEVVPNAMHLERDKWLHGLLSSMHQIHKDIRELKATEEIEKRIASDHNIVQFMERLYLQEVMHVDHYAKLASIFRGFLAELKASTDLYVTAVYSSSQTTYENRNLVSLIEHNCYVSAYLAVLSNEVSEQIDKSVPLQPQIVEEPQREIQPEENDKPPLKTLLEDHAKILSREFLCIGKAFSSYSEEIKQTIVDIVQKSSQQQESWINRAYKACIDFAKDAIKRAEIAPAGLTIPIIMTQYIIHYWTIGSLLPDAESTSIGGLLRYCVAQDNIIVAFLIKHTVVSMLKVVLKLTFGDRLVALEDGINYKSVQFIRSMLFNAVFLNFFKEIARKRTWASIMIDTTAIEILSYFDELSFNLYNKVAQVRVFKAGGAKGNGQLFPDRDGRF